MSASGGNTSGFMSSLRSSFSSGVGVKMSSPPTDSTNISTQPISDQSAVLQNQSNPPTNQTVELDAAEQALGMANVDLGNLAQVMPQTLTSVIPDPLNPPNPSPVGATKKEVYQVGAAAQEAPAPTPEYPAGVQTVEQEKTPEISPEVESFLKHAEEQPDQLPQEIVIADNQEVSAVTHHPKQPVVVLPISAKDQEEGKNKDFKFSIRWLVEWSVKIMKKFSGKVIYKEEPTA